MPLVVGIEVTLPEKDVSIKILNAFSMIIRNESLLLCKIIYFPPNFKLILNNSLIRDQNMMGDI